MCSVGAAGAGLNLLGTFGKMKQADLENEMQTKNIREQMQINAIKAQEVLNAGQIAEQAKRTETRKILGAQNAAMAASGLQTTGGTFGRIKEDTAKTGELDARTIQRNAMMQAWAYRAENVMLKNKEEYLDEAAKNKKWGAFFGGAGSLIGNFGG